ncbi:hypothetical protein CERSUDRAFT_96131 [Gelatoporia subvermispora B]|uniref:Uncharacterized protein n=1 Tax=Ceriporiopsis subvermispora (strain B) TaxID=914234 RepID=M2RAV2_CERS8|nr:hypothetical protein CERSUDRAFT_96131 [Gelatoporia subvermispora B]
MSDPAAPTTGPALLSIAVQVLQQLEQHQRSLVEHQRVVATQQAALLEQQHLIFTQQAALIEQQRIIAVTAVRAANKQLNVHAIKCHVDAMRVY